MTDKVKLASVGVGRWANVIADAAEAGGEAEIVSCFARTAAKRDAFAEQRGCRSAGSLDELLGDSEVQGVLIATSHTSHRQLVEAAAAAGKHIFVEKPLTLNVDDGAACLEAAAAAGVALQVGHQRRRSTASRRIKEMIDSGDLGAVHAIETNLSVPNGLSMPPEAWRWSREESPLGSMPSLGIHHIDTLRCFAGPVRSVFAYARSGSNYPIDEFAVVALEFESGTLGTILTTFFTPSIARVAVFGSGGSVFSERDGATLAIQRPGEAGPTSLDIVPNNPVVDQMDEFIRVVRGEAQPEADGAVGLEAVAVMEAAVASSQSGRAVEVADYR